jgi:type I restriction enzyme R subunit
VFKTPNEWRNRFATVPHETKGGQWEDRYYKHNAVHNALEAIVAGKQRILLTLATGTGKTAIAFQIAWTLFQTRWNLSRKPERRPRILFLADRNILADQAYNAFSAFPEDALARIKPDEIRKKGRVPKNASVFFTIFQTFMSGTGADGQPEPYFGDILRTSSTSSLLTSATAAAPMTRATGATFSITSRQPCSSASPRRRSAATTWILTDISANPSTSTR